MLILASWVGRLGNNIKQMEHIIDNAIINKHNIIFNVKHELFNVSIIEKYFSKYNNDKKIESTFFYPNVVPLKYLSKEQFEERNNILKEAFLLKNINKLPENDIVIHIRSGDIFTPSNTWPEYCAKGHNSYIPPPLSYYIREINKYKYETMYIVCEDTVNPVVNELLKLYKKSVYTKNLAVSRFGSAGNAFDPKAFFTDEQIIEMKKSQGKLKSEMEAAKNTLETDIRIILGATNILYSIGSFIPSLLLLSDNIKYIHPTFKSMHKKSGKKFYDHSYDFLVNESFWKYKSDNIMKQKLVESSMTSGLQFTHSDCSGVCYKDHFDKHSLYEKINEYYKILTPWLNTKEQREMLLTFKM